MSEEPKSIVDASRQTANLPLSMTVNLSSGQSVAVRRLNWIEFEALWSELADILGGLLSGNQAVTAEALTARLAAAPAFVLKLVGLTTSLDEGELARLPFNEVLDLAATGLQINFVLPSGVRDFFGALAEATEASNASAPPPARS